MREKFQTKEITPNFVNEDSRLAEERMHELIKIAQHLDVEIFSIADSKEEILEKVKHNFSERYELVVQKLNEEGLSLADLSKNTLLDRMLGIDALFTFDGKVYAVDVTSGQHTVVVNKEKKISRNGKFIQTTRHKPCAHFTT